MHKQFHPLWTARIRPRPKAGQTVAGLAATLLVTLAGVPHAPAVAQTASALQTCMIQEMSIAPGETTISELRQRCASILAEKAGPTGQEAVAELDTTVRPEDIPDDETPAVEPNAVERRYGSELAIRDNPFGLTAHKPNYILLAAYNTRTNPEPFEKEFEQDVDLDDVESKFQLSIKFPLGVGLFGGRADLMAGYTLRTFWQVYNGDESKPFRDYNHEPEIWMSFLNDAQVLGWRNAANSAGYVHQSNGRGGEFLSRSWDRLYAKFLFEKDDQLLWLKPWLIINDGDGDNPDIEDYMGHGEIGWSWAIKNEHTVSTMLRNHLESGFSKGTTQVSWSFPIPKYDHLRGYLQVFNGYGENLMDYNKQNTSIGIGVSLTDWLH